VPPPATSTSSHPRELLEDGRAVPVDALAAHEAVAELGDEDDRHLDAPTGRLDPEERARVLPAPRRLRHRGRRFDEMQPLGRDLRVDPVPPHPVVGRRAGVALEALPEREVLEHAVGREGRERVLHVVPVLGFEVSTQEVLVIARRHRFASLR
jgi:hypothetical protein